MRYTCLIGVLWVLLWTVVVPVDAQQKRSRPDTLWVLSLDGTTPAEQALALSVQGLANREEARLWIRTPGMSALLLAELQAEGTKVETLPTVWDAVHQFRSLIKGAVVYKEATESLNVATSLCGVVDGVAVGETLLERAKTENLPLIQDVRTLDSLQAFMRFKMLFHHGMAVEQGINKTGHLRDYAVAHRAFVYSTTDEKFRTEVAREFGPNALIFGWGDDEYRFVASTARANATTVPSDWLRNLSALEHLPAGKLARPKTNPAPKAELGTRYVAFVISDGDNIQWLCGNFPTDKGFWANPARGQFPMTWEVSPLLAEVAPRALQYFYSHATPNDAFITGAGVPGYTYPHFQSNREAIARQAAVYLKRSDLPIISVLNANEGNMEEMIPLLDLPEVEGIVYKDYAPYNRRKGELIWHKGKPCLAYKFLLWEGVQSIEQTLQGISQMPTNPEDPNSYALIQVHAWSYKNIGGPMEAIQRAIKQLPPNTKVVTVPDMFALMKDNVKARNEK